MNLPNKQIILNHRPTSTPTEETFGFRNIPIDELKTGQVLIKTLYLSVDPYMRWRMNNEKSYIEPFTLHEPINGTMIGEVIASQSEQLNPGDKVQGFLPWQLYNTVHAQEVSKLIDRKDFPLSAYLSVLGVTGLTAYFGMLDIGQPKKGETVVVSGAAGAVGSIAGQIAKIKGARVVGIAGSDEKVTHLVNKLGFDKGINYKKTDSLQKTLEEALPNGVDVYFDNIGGHVSDMVTNFLNNFARIPLCGTMSTYNLTEKEDVGPRIHPKLIKTRSLLQGFNITDFEKRYDEALLELAEWVSTGQLRYDETIKEGFENVPNAFLDLFRGENLGKQIVKISDPAN